MGTNVYVLTVTGVIISIDVGVTQMMVPGYVPLNTVQDTVT